MKTTDKEKDSIKCSFCGRDKQDTAVLIAGIDGHICDRCIAQAYQIVTDEFASKSDKEDDNELNLLKPVEIKTYLDQYVIGQDQAKKVLAVAVYNHFKRLVQTTNDDDEIEVEKSNVILVGYVGEDVESILSRLLQAADYDQKAAEKGIVFIDEVDKIARKGDNASITRDVSGEGVQQGLLKLLEGSIVNVPPQGGRKHPEQKMVAVDTKNILFICGGAFDGIERLIAKRMQTHTIGYGAREEMEEIDEENLLQYINAQDIKSFGLIPELIGRLPVVSHLSPLDKDALRRILTEPKNALIKQYTKLFGMDDIELTVKPEVLDFITEKAIEFGLGARGLRSLCEAILLDAMYELPTQNEKKVVVTKAYAEDKLAKTAMSKLRAA
jgi:ATP-dependent Clp protease ATP-binding subunit ClpX